MQEILNRRTRHEKHFDLGNGQIQMIQQRGLHYHDGTGWQDYDGNIEYDTTLDDKGKRYGHKVKKAQHNLRIANGKLKVGFEKGVSVEYGIPNLPADVAGNVYTIANAWLDSDLRLTVTPEGVKNDIILKAPGHPSVFSFPMACTGCVPQQEGDAITFYRQCQLIGNIPAPFAEDANGDRGHVALDYDGETIKFVPDPIWLASAAYPVTVDPTTVLQPDGVVGKDARVYSTNPTSNYTALDTLNVGYYGRYRSLIQFDVSAFSGTIVSSVMSLNNWQTSALGMDIFVVTAPWEESTVTWNTQPAVEATPRMTIAGLALGWDDFDITQITQEWADNPVTNNGLLLRAVDTTGLQLRFYSSDYAVDASLRPKLTVTYTEGASSNPTSLFGSINALGRRLIA